MPWYCVQTLYQTIEHLVVGILCIYDKTRPITKSVTPSLLTVCFDLLVPCLFNPILPVWTVHTHAIRI